MSAISSTPTTQPNATVPLTVATLTSGSSSSCVHPPLTASQELFPGLELAPPGSHLYDFYHQMSDCSNDLTHLWLVSSACTNAFEVIKSSLGKMSQLIPPVLVGLDEISHWMGKYHLNRRTLTQGEWDHFMDQMASQDNIVLNVIEQHEFMIHDATSTTPQKEGGGESTTTTASDSSTRNSQIYVITRSGSIYCRRNNHRGPGPYQRFPPWYFRFVRAYDVDQVRTFMLRHWTDLFQEYANLFRENGIDPNDALGGFQLHNLDSSALLSDELFDCPLSIHLWQPPHLIQFDSLPSKVESDNDEEEEEDEEEIINETEPNIRTFESYARTSTH